VHYSSVTIKIINGVVPGASRLAGLQVELSKRASAQPYISQEKAEEIAQKLERKSQDVRDAVRVARLSPQLGTDKAIGLLYILKDTMSNVMIHIRTKVESKESSLIGLG